jgi:hypothetical protein
MVEFAIVLFLLLSVIFAGFEFDRMMMVYTTLANSARVGVRYAIVHGSNRTGTGDPPSGAANDPIVTGVIKDWAKIGFLNVNGLDVAVEYPSGNTPGSPVIVTVTYPYDPLTFIPVSVNLSSTSRGVIVF